MNPDFFISKSFLTILTGKNCILLDSLQEFTETEAWTPLTFLLLSRNELISMHSAVTH